MRHRKFELAILLAFLLVGLICIIQTRPKYKNAETNMMQSNVNPSYDGFKAEVGRAAWKFLHTLGSKFPQNPTLEEKERYLGFILEFSKLYPCQECREDFQKILKGSPPQVRQSYLTPSKVSSNYDFNLWLCHVHNLVNIKLGKPEFDCSVLQERWSDCGCSKEKVTGDGESFADGLSSFK